MRLLRSGAILLAGCLVAHQLQAQSVSVMAGGSFAKFGGAEGNSFGTAKTRVGIAAGVTIDVSLLPALLLEPGVMFAQKGVTAEASSGTSTFRIGYFEIPLLLKLRKPAAGNGRQLSPHVFGGAAFGFKVSCGLSETPTGGSAVSQTCFQAGDEIKTTDASLVGGVGLDVGRTTIDARYDLGLSKVDASTPQRDFKNRTFYLLIGWTFRAPH